MTANKAREAVPDRRRGIGPAGTAARVAVGLTLLGAVFWGELGSGRMAPPSLVLGLVVFPAVVLAAQWLRARRDPTPLRATGPLATAANFALVAALYLTPFYAPALAPTSDATLFFYGSSMLLAALRGYGGCEVLAASNWLLRRDDQVGCLAFGPVDALERRLRG